MNQNMQKEIKTRSARIWLDENGIIRIVYLHGSEETLEDAKVNNQAIIHVSFGKKRPLFVNPEYQRSMSREARIYYIEHASDLTAIAGIVASPYTKILASFMLTLNKTISRGKTPIELFTSEKKAIVWLKEFLT